MLNNTKTNFGTIAKIFHWSMPLFIIIMFAIAYIMTDLSDGVLKTTLYLTHKITGGLILAMALFRIFWRINQPQAELSTNTLKWQVYAATVNAMLLYILMLIVPISGLVLNFAHAASIIEIADNIHSTSATLLLLCAIVHILGAIYHHFTRKDNVLKRMLPSHN